ncbi:MAG: HigA family addiction module antidote protein [candidate division Zixibacteria bacterium]|nr:HigA family addiction module antidote protein [candidate division Zixibacteria bacterium]
MKNKMLPEGFLPGEYIREEAEERGWTPTDLAAILGCKPNIVSDLFAGRRSISAELAKALGDAFGTGAQVWLNLQSAYRLATTSSADDAVARRARLYEKAPISDMLRRGWIEGSTNINVLEAEICRFLEIDSIDQEVVFQHAARKSTRYESLNSTQLAWLKRAKKLAEALPVEGPYSSRNFDGLLEEIEVLKYEPEELRHLPGILSKYGIRFLILEHLPKTKIDGACFWLDEQSPVIVLSLRYDRIDWFWHSLIHELSHIKNRDGLKQPVIENKMFGEGSQPTDEKPSIEKRADAFAVATLIDQNELKDFINRNHPTYSRSSIIGFSRRIGIHRGIIVGQLQHRGRVPYSHFRAMLVKIRNIITATALTDGWGKTVSL